MDLLLDHLVYFVRDVEASQEALRQAGFHVVAGGRHPRWGTYNALCHFGLTYLELLGVSDAEEAGKATVATSAQALLDIPLGDGLGRFVLRTRDLDHVDRRWRQAGLAGEVTPGERLRPDGTVLRWRLLFPPWSQDRSFPMPFVIEWGQSDEAREEDLGRVGAIAPHPNGAERILGVAAAVSDLDGVTQLFTTLYGVAPSDPISLPGQDGRLAVPFHLPNATVFFYEGETTTRGERPDLVFLQIASPGAAAGEIRRGAFHLVLVPDLRT